MAAPTRTGVAPAGTSSARKIECSKSKYHGFHPEDEECTYCEPARPTLEERAISDGMYDWSWFPKLSSNMKIPIVTKPRVLTYAQPPKQFQKVVGVDGQVTWTIKL